MGWVLAFAFVLTGRLALLIGIHLADNLTGNGVFGITVVATNESPTLVGLAFTGPDVFVRVTGVVSGAFAIVGALRMPAWIRWLTGEHRFQTDFASWRQ